MTLHDVLKFAGHVAANVTISEIPLVKVHMRSIYYKPDNICGRRIRTLLKGHLRCRQQMRKPTAQRFIVNDYELKTKDFWLSHKSLVHYALIVNH